MLKQIIIVPPPQQQNQFDIQCQIPKLGTQVKRPKIQKFQKRIKKSKN